jgi:hypothetical protein
VRFQYGTTTAYGTNTTFVRVGPAITAQPITQTITGLTSGTMIHFRVSVQTDFGTFNGADRTFTTP